MHQGAGGYLHWYALCVGSGRERKVLAQLRLSGFDELPPFRIPIPKRLSWSQSEPPPFAGSCLRAGWDQVIGVEKSAEYVKMARRRLAAHA